MNERHDRTAAHDDATRRPVGETVLLGCIARAPRPFPDVRLSDAGCGTGNCAAAPVDRAGHPTGLDPGPAVPARARAGPEAEGRLEAFLRGQDAARPEIGRITILCAIRE